MKRLLAPLLPALVLSFAQFLYADIIINELMSSNGFTIADEDGDYEDWIELANTGNEIVDLSGWGLSDNPSKPYKWTFPSGSSIEPGEFLLVWASGKDRNAYTPAWPIPYQAEAAGIWLFQENGGTVTNDLSPNARHASLTGPITFSERAPKITALDFSVGSHAKLPDPVQIPGDFTVSYWFNTRRSNAWMVLNRPHTNQGLFGHANSGLITFWSPYRTILVSKTIPSNSWNHFVVTRKDNQITIFNNGELIGQGEWNGILQFDQLGGANSGIGWSNGLDGTVSDVMVLPKSLDNSEVVTLHEKQLAGSFHTNFSISSSGEDIVLTDAQENLIDILPAVSLPADISYGRTPQSEEYSYFNSSTPGTENLSTPYSEILSPPEFSQPAGFYQQDFQLEITHPDPEVTILYTLDGSKPHTDHLSGTTYKYKNEYPINAAGFPGPFLERTKQTYVLDGPLLINDRSSIPYQISGINTAASSTPLLPLSNPYKGTVVRVTATKTGALPSQTNTSTYFVSPEGTERFELPVISLTTDEDHLFDFEQGIYVAGKIGEETILNSYAPGLFGNFHGKGLTWEKPLHIEFFQPSGIEAFKGDIGTRIHGAATRNRPRKSLRALFRSRYNNPLLEYPLFDDLSAYDGSGRKITSFHAFIMRNSGNDYNQTLIRDAVQQKIFEHLPIATQAYRPAIHFINGEYWGITNIRERIDKHYLASHYSVDSEQVAILEAFAKVDLGSNDDRENYLNIVNYATSNDLDQEHHFDWISQRVDLTDISQYFAVQIIISNDDWPHNNIKYWRLRLDNNQPDAPVGHDGRWRFLVYDLDKGFASNGISRNSFDHVFNSQTPSSILLEELLKNDNYKNKFINTIADMLNTIFLPSRIEEIVDTTNEKLLNSRSEHYQRWRSGTFSSNYMKDFANQRPAHMRSHIIQNFNLPGMHQLALQTSGNGHLQINETPLTPETPGVSENPYPWFGIYFEDVPVTITATPEPGYKFSHWQELTGQPDEHSAVIQINLTDNTTYTAVFTEDTTPVLTDIHAWDFEDETNYLNPSFSIIPGANLNVTPGSHAEAEIVRHNKAAQDFDSAHLRINYPLGATLELALPTTGYKSISLTFDSRRSGQGAGLQTLSYTLDGGSSWTELDTYEIFDKAPQPLSFDFSSITGTANNPDFAIRITFSQNEDQLDPASSEVGTEGNNRFDNVTLHGYLMSASNLPPVVANPIARQETWIGGTPISIDLNQVFTDPEDAPLAFTASADPATHATATISDGILSITGQATGNCTFTVTASDGTNPPTSTSFHTLIYPAPHRLADTDYFFREWSPQEPAGSFPSNMVFLQSELEDDAEIDTPLTQAYWINPEHAADPEDVELPYAATKRTRISGHDKGGISFVRTGNGVGIGSALLALDTRDVDTVEVSWLAGTIEPNSRIYGLRLQARNSIHSEFQDVLINGQPIEYIRNETAGHQQSFGPITLPSSMLGLENLQLQWRYHYISEKSARAQLQLDDIVVTTGGPARNYEIWRLTEYPGFTDRDNDNLSGPHAESEGHPNLLRYALGVSKDDQLTGYLPTLNEDGTAFSFPFYPAKTDIRYLAQRSPDLDSWTDIFDSQLDDWSTLLDSNWLTIPDLEEYPEGRTFYRLEIEER